MLARRLVRQLAPIAEAENLSMTEVLVLWKINRKQTCRVSEIAAEVGTSPSTLTGILDRLVAANLLSRDADPADRRAVLLKTTPLVKPLLKRMLVQSEQHLGRIFSDYPAERLERLAEDLQGLLACLDVEEEHR